jgi:transcriptional accessory protein Tex/SPT6
MTAVKALAISPETLAKDAQRVQAFSNSLKARVVEVAEALAKTEESIAATMDWLASQQPERAERLKALRESARKQAALARQWGDRSDVADEPEPRRGPARDSQPTGRCRGAAMAAMWVRRNATG